MSTTCLRSALALTASQGFTTVIPGIVLMIAALILPREWFWFIWILQVSNLSGSAGDIYCVWFLARMEDDLLIQDTGVRMRIFRRNAPPIEDMT